MNIWWYIHTATLYQFSCRWTRNDIYILQLYINFLVMNTGWYIHIATLYQFSRRWTGDDIYVPQLYINFPGDEHLLIYTYHNCISIFEQMNTWWFIHTATLYQLSSRWTRDDIYIPQLYINFPADEHLMIYTYRNFISTFQRMHSRRYIHSATLYQFLADKYLMIYTYRKLISTFITINTGWYIHTATLYQFSCRWTPDDIYIPQLYINFPTDELLMIYTYCNFISTFLQMMTWWDIHTATL